MMKIRVTLGPDRAEPGELVVESDRGHLANLFKCPCLGKADNGEAADHDNPTRDPTKSYGDTPTGRYPQTKVVWFDDRTPIGEAGIPLPLEGAVGEQVEAAQRNGRSGLYIHAGRGSGTLRPSYGCLRVRFGDFVRILLLVSGHEINVTIKETSK